MTRYPRGFPEPPVDPPEDPREGAFEAWLEEQDPKTIEGLSSVELFELFEVEWNERMDAAQEAMADYLRDDSRWD